MISIHALLAESDGDYMLYNTSSLIFLSTLSLRRATVASLLAVGRAGYFYPRSPCGERLNIMLYNTSSLIFLSTLSLRRATREGPRCQGLSEFLSTLSLRRATNGVLLASGSSSDFYPRSPCGERPVKLFRQNYECFISIHALLAESDIILIALSIQPIRFLSTLSLRRATASVA